MLFDGSRVLKLFAYLHGIMPTKAQLAEIWLAVSRLYDGTQANGDFLKWLIEHGPEIIALVRAIISLFAATPVAESVESVDVVAEMKELF